MRLFGGGIKSSRGMTLLEMVVALALAAVFLPAAAHGVITIINHSDFLYDRSIVLELAESQVEDLQRQEYHEDAALYSLISSPEGYRLSVTAEPATIYTYAAPQSTATPETIQVLTIAVTGVRGSLEVQTYKVRR